MDDLLKVAPTALAEKLAPTIAAIDTRFFDLTQPTKKPTHWAERFGFAPWAVRVPKKFREDDFLPYLIREGYL